MSNQNLDTGAMVKILRHDWAGSVGIVTKPITEANSGHVLLYRDGTILGMEASLEDVALPDEGSEGFAQLGYQLIKLGSRVIEQKLIVYRT